MKKITEDFTITSCFVCGESGKLEAEIQVCYCHQFYATAHFNQGKKSALLVESYDLPEGIHDAICEVMEDHELEIYNYLATKFNEEEIYQAS